ncbi:hypothetical protein [Bradyrhizobium liaoningense]
MLAISRILLDDNHEIAFLTGIAFRDRIEASGAQFLALPPTLISTGGIFSRRFPN